MSEFTKYPLSEQTIPDSDAIADPSINEIDFYVQRGKRLHSKAVRDVLFAGFCSVGKAADRLTATVGQAFRKEGHSPS